MNKILSIDIYERDLMVHFGKKEDLKKRLSKMFGDKYSSEVVSLISDEDRGKSILLDGGQMILFMPKVPKNVFDLSVLAHEIFHITDYTMEKAGIRLTESSDEAYSYLIQFLTKKILGMIPISFSDDVQSA